MKHIQTFENIFDQFDTGDDFKLLRDITEYVSDSSTYKLISKHNNFVKFKLNLNYPFYYSVFINESTFELNFQIFNDKNNPLNNENYIITDFSELDSLVSKVDPFLSMSMYKEENIYYFLEMLYAKDKQQINWLYFIDNDDVTTEKIVNKLTEELINPIRTYRKIPNTDLDNNIFDLRYHIITEKSYMVVMIVSPLIPLKLIVGPKKQLELAMSDSIEKI